MVNAQPRIYPKNETHKVLSDFEIQTDHQISSRRPDLVIKKDKKRTCRIVNFAVSADYRIELKEFERIDNYLDLEKELKKIIEHEGNGDTNCYWWS